MDSPKLVVLDVGHGSSAVLHDSQGLVVVDAGLRNTLDEYLNSIDTQEVVALLISHSDADHLAGASNILLSENLNVRAVYLNPDGAQGSVAFQSFRLALADSRRRNGTVVHTQLTSTTGASITAGEILIEVLGPSPSLATAGNGGKDLKGRRIRTNTMSAVVRLSSKGRKIALLPGDIDQIALENLLEENKEIQAETLVFPHHGGLPGTGNPTSFAQKLTLAVQPKVVLFSTGRGDRNINPHPAIVAAVKEARPDVHIGCTELSTQCALQVPSAAQHLSNLIAEGTPGGRCCIGTVEIALGTETAFFPILEQHARFVAENIPSALCRAIANPALELAESPV
jgi:beta-lactamase superfamily II metal-dependent hydrolase